MASQNSIESVDDCAHCIEDLRNVWVGDWNCPGCRARMLARLPSREFRLGWMHRWREQGEHLMAMAVSERLRMMDQARGRVVR